MAAPAASTVLQIIQLVLALEPAAMQLVLQLVNGLTGKTDADVLAADAQTWAQIVIDAHAAQQPPVA